jgi:hypothetical protein
MGKIYNNKKVFYPRLANNEVWNFFCEKLDFENRHRKYFDWCFTDLDEDEELSIGYWI